MTYEAEPLGTELLGVPLGTLGITGTEEVMPPAGGLLGATLTVE